MFTAHQPQAPHDALHRKLLHVAMLPRKGSVFPWANPVAFDHYVAPRRGRAVGSLPSFPPPLGTGKGHVSSRAFTTPDLEAYSATG